MIEITRFGRSKPEFILGQDPRDRDAEMIIARYLHGMIDANQLELELDVIYRPQALRQAIRDGVYDRNDVITAVMERYGSDLINPGMPAPSDARFLFMGEPL